MKCEICNVQAATMWVAMVRSLKPGFFEGIERKAILSCDDCGPRLGYKVLASLHREE